MSTNFYFRLIKYSLKTQSDFLKNFGNSTKYCLNSIRFFLLQTFGLKILKTKLEDENLMDVNVSSAKILGQI